MPLIDNSNTLIVGAQLGDEGKGMLTDYLGSDYDTFIRFQGGCNAGHTVVVDGEETVLHLLPSAVLRDEASCMVGSGTVIDPETLVDEIEHLNIDPSDDVYISNMAAVTTPAHIALDAAGKQGEIGTTGSGIGPTYSDLIARNGLRIKDLLNPDNLKERLPNIYDRLNTLIKQHHDQPDLTRNVNEDLDRLVAWGEKIEDFCCDLKDPSNDPYLWDLIEDQDEKVLFEGAQGTMIDVTHGMYPYVTSSHPTSAGLCSHEGISPEIISTFTDVIGVTKAYCTRVGAGPFPTKVDNPDIEQRLREEGGEFGSTTGRPRSCGWVDIPQLSYAHSLNGFNSLAVTKLDVLTGLDEVKVCVGYQKPDGSRTSTFYPSLEAGRVEPIYETFDGWDKEITDAQSWDDLPDQAQTLTRMIVDLTASNTFEHVWVSVGPNRRQTFRTNESEMGL